MTPTDSLYFVMRKETNRLKTFHMDPARSWPKDYIDIKKLAQAGFFYAFYDDLVHCAFCHGQVCQWLPGDDPMSEHARHFSTCPFIMGGDVGNEPAGEDPFPGPKRPRPYDVCGIFPSIPAMDSSNSSNISSNDEQEVEEPIINSHYSIENHVNNTIQTNTLYTEQSNIIIDNNTNQYRSIVCNQDPPATNEYTAICKICYNSPIEICFIPCGHSLCCTNCSERFCGCPLCRTSITTKIRTYIV